LVEIGEIGPFGPRFTQRGYWGKGKLQQTNEEQPGTPGGPVGIVGGSAAGLFAALRLAQAGRSVRLFERAERLDPAFRTLIVTHRIRDLLGSSFERSVVNEIRRFELFTDGRAATIQLDSPDLIIERSSLIRALADEAQGHGAQLEFGRRFASLEAKGAGIEMTLAKAGPRKSGTGYERVCCSAVVGADGAQSSVARAAGWTRLTTVPLVQAIVKLPSGMPSDTVRVWFVPDDTPYFYWLIPESEGRGALGLIGVDGRQTRRCLDRFMEKRHFRALAFQGARIPIYEGWVPVERRLGGGSVYLVGDAAAQVKVTTVGGVVTGFRGALGVSESILNGGRSRELRMLRRELDVHLLIRRSIHGFRQADYSRLVDWMDNAMRRTLSRVTRDEGARVLWQICRNRPRLVLLGLRGLLARSLQPAKCRDSSMALPLSSPSVIQR
jgi:geranylgeranyl diphosphate/geranylgeranyl-bacteriochlorophyllide a reductase